MNRMRTRWAVAAVTVAISVVVAAGCGKKQAPVVRPQPPAPTASEGGTTFPPPPTPPPPIVEPELVPTVPADGIGSKDLDALNRDSPLIPVFFGLDRFELDAEARTLLDASARVLREQSTWQVTVEGHCDERGTAEYNISLGERRAVAAKSYLVSLGIAAERLRTVSYGKEFPFDPGHDESAWAANRRAHFVITSK